MGMKLSSEKEHLVLENQRLIHYLVKKLGITSKSSEYEDIISIGNIGLIKAAITFDESKKITFATYASRCINNEIFMYYRKASKYANDISLDETIGDDGEGKELTLGETIEHSESDFVERIVHKEAFIQLVSIILNKLEGKERLVILYRIGEVLQAGIAERLNITKSYVSRVLKKSISEIRTIANNNVSYKEVFSMDIVGDEYRISFASKDISNFKKIFATFLQNLASTEGFPDFRVNCNKERIIIQVPAHPKSFSFIAEIIQEIDEFSMTFVSDKSNLPVGNTDMQKVESDALGQRGDTIDIEKETLVKKSIIENIAATSEELDTVERGSKIKQVRDYMLSMSSFTVKDLKRYFPNFTTATINNAVYLAKSKGFITATARGEYVVNKN